MLKAILIEDEPDARADLRQSLAAHGGDVTVIAEAETLDEAEALLARDDYDVVFLDVKLRGATGFDLVPRVRPEARIVFVTAHDRYALRAFEVNALDYLLKPVSPDRLAATIARIVATVSARTHAGEPDDIGGVPMKPDDIVFLRGGGHGRFARLSEVSAIEADQNYSVACLADGSRHMLRRTLKAWEELLPAPHFMRVHRTAIVNLERITRYERDREERTLLFVEGVGEPVNATRKVWSDLQERLVTLRRAL